MAFAPGVPATDVAAYILPRTLKLKLNAAKPEKSLLVGAGFFDLGPEAVDLSLGATLDVGGYEVVAPGLVANKASTAFTLEQAGRLFTVKVAKSGSSRALFKVKVQDELDGLVDPDGELPMPFTHLAVDAAGIVSLEQGKDKLGKKRGAITSASLDYLRETVTVTAKGVDLGPDGQEPQPVDVTLQLGADVRTVSVRLVAKGKALRY